MDKNLPQRNRPGWLSCGMEADFPNRVFLTFASEDEAYAFFLALKQKAAQESRSHTTRICPNCNCEVDTPPDESHCMSDEEWERYVNNLVLPEEEARVNALERWLS